MRRILLSVLSILFIISNVYAEDKVNKIDNIIFVKGVNVNCRSTPSVNGKIIKKINNTEIYNYVAKSTTKDKVGSDEDYWYKIVWYANDNKSRMQSGWVFGKFITLPCEDLVDGKIYKDVLKSEFEFWDSVSDVQGFSLKKDRDVIIIKYFYISHPEVINEMNFYRISQDGIFVKIFHAQADSIYFYVGDNIFIENGRKNLFEVYNINSFTKDKYSYKPVVQLTEIDYLSVYKGNPKKEIYDSYLDFDPNTLIFTAHLREDPKKDFLIEKYKFNTQTQKLEKIN